MVKMERAAGIILYRHITPNHSHAPNQSHAPNHSSTTNQSNTNMQNHVTTQNNTNTSKYIREYLILKYADYKDYWGLCKGGIEAGESTLQTALREAKEETGCENIKLNPNFQQMTNYFYTRNGEKIQKEVTWFLGEVLSDQIKLSTEHSEFMWLPIKEALGKIKHKKDAHVVKAADAYLSAYKTADIAH
jgi:8-oxo-dGTP pyrophosphatase MutT (NUDIX family)